jgi:hypothetical protein
MENFSQKSESENFVTHIQRKYGSASSLSKLVEGLVNLEAKHDILQSTER